MADPTEQSFRLAVGQAKTLAVTLDEPESVAGWSMRFRLTQGAKVISLTSGSGVTVTDAVNGVWEIALVTSDTDDLRQGTAKWSFWNIATGEESPVAFGTCVVYQTG